MHDLRSASVNNTRLSCAAAAHRLHVFLRYMSTQLFGDICRFMSGLSSAVRHKKAVMIEKEEAAMMSPSSDPSAFAAEPSREVGRQINMMYAGNQRAVKLEALLAAPRFGATSTRCVRGC